MENGAGAASNSSPSASSPMTASTRSRSAERRERERCDEGGRGSPCGRNGRGVDVAGITARLEAPLGAKIDTIKNEVAQTVGQTLRDMDQAMQARFEHIESRAGQDRMRIGILERHAQLAEERMHKLEKNGCGAPDGMMRTATWNCRALLHHRASVRHKMRYLFGQLKMLDIVMLQEVHGTEEEFALEMAPMRHRFLWVFPGGRSSVEGGIAIVVWRTLVESLESEEIVRGRMVRATVSCRSGGRIHLVRLHNLGIDLASMNRAMRAVRTLAGEAMASPLESVLWVAGDMHADAPGEGVQSAQHLQRGAGACAPRRRAHASLEGRLRMLTEVDQPLCTRMAEAA